MVTNIQVRAVDERLAEATKAKAEATHRSLSAYVRELIERDLSDDLSRRAMGDLLAEIADDPRRPRVSRAETAAALAEVRRDLGAA